MNRYIDPMETSLVLMKTCKKLGKEMKSLCSGDMPGLLLTIASNRELFNSIDDQQFCNLLKDLTRLSNDNNPTVTRDSIKDVRSGMTG